MDIPIKTKLRYLLKIFLLLYNLKLLYLLSLRLYVTQVIPDNYLFVIYYRCNSSSSVFCFLLFTIMLINNYKKKNCSKKNTK